MLKWTITLFTGIMGLMLIGGMLYGAATNNELMVSTTKNLLTGYAYFAFFIVLGLLVLATID